MSPLPPQRVSSIPFPDQYRLPAGPADAPAAVQDAFRQTMFVLGEELRLFEEGMGLQLRIVRDSSASPFRTQPYAALMALWSRAYLALSDGCLLVTRGSYASCPTLARAACEHIAAQRQLQASEMEQYLSWLGAGLRPHERHRAIDLGMGRYFAGEVLGTDERLRAVYRPASELGRPNFGATLLLVGPESNNVRLAQTFGDASFHVGWAELTLGWLLGLCERQLAVAVHAEAIFSISEETHLAYAELARRIDAALSRPDRCRIAEVEDDGARRYLVHNFRRQPSGAPKRVLL